LKAMWFVEGFTTFEQLGKQDEHPYNRRVGHDLAWSFFLSMKSNGIQY